MKEKNNQKVNYPLLFGLLGILAGSTILFMPLLNIFTTGETINIQTFALVNFAGYLFITMTFVEVLFAQIILLGGNPLTFTMVAIITGLLSLSTDYLIGHTFSRAVLNKIISEKKLEKYQQRIEKYGNPIIFTFNVLPLSSPLLTLAAGLIRYDYKKLMIYSALGLVIKYVAIAISIAYFL